MIKFNLNQFRNKGMTMIEILIVASLIGVVGVSIYGALSVGLKVWQRSQGAVIEQDVSIFLDKLTKDLNNTFYYSLLPAEGGQQRLAFPGFVRASPTGKEDEEVVTQIGLIEYKFDVLENILYRSQAGYGAAMNNKFTKSQIVLEGVDNVQFSYIYISDRQQIESDHLLETLPASVEVVIIFEDLHGRREIKKNIDLPISL